MEKPFSNIRSLLQIHPTRKNIFQLNIKHRVYFWFLFIWSLLAFVVRFSLLKACVRYFSLFLKDRCISSLFRSTLKRNSTYSCFFFPLFHKHLFFPGLPRATRFLETSCFEKITVCVIETMFVTLPLVQMKVRREVNRTNQVQTKINNMKGLQTSVIHLIHESTCHWISHRMIYFLKNIF